MQAALQPIESKVKKVKNGAGREASERVIRILALTLLISVMSATTFTIVLPEIRAEYRLTYAQVSWVTTAYLLLYAIGTVIYGKLADHYRLKNLLTFGLIFFSFGSMIGLAAQAYWMVLLGRALQAAGAAVIPAAAGIIPVRYFPPERRGRALGIAMTGLAIGGAAGPMITSLFMSIVHWRFLFCIPLITLIAIPFYRKYLNDAPREKGSIDWLGGGLLGGSAALLLLAITNEAWLPGVGSVALFLLFLLRIRFATNPFIRLELFRNRSYSLVLIIAILNSGVGYSLAFLSPQLLSQVHRLAPHLVGYVMVPAAIATAILSRKAGKLADDRGNPFVFYVASSLLLACFLLLSLSVGAPPFYMALTLILGNVGQSFMMIVLSNTLSRSLPQEQTGVGMGLLSMLNFISGAIAASIYSAIIDRGASSGWLGVTANPAAFVYSNLYLVLALIHVLLFAYYYVFFGRAESRSKRQNARFVQETSQQK
ncbi:MFS transporter [Paenibacillus soyae]|uniref:MFS transporter n=1 Tax=Paenibacillus soyae TaxID=2969249 RepID=A0A9X2SAP4_9BACL|nr:MFS transporter [Paenibacillus soyae]MCR2806929.1 MFS transporter [Paenibacillus soyae]